MGMLERHASRLVRAVRRDQRDEIRTEILGHLYDLASDARRRGLSECEALRSARDRFGDRGRLRIDLGRASRGKRTVLFPRGLKGWLASVLIYDLRPLLVVLILVALIRVLIVGVYHIPTRSMEPTLIGRADNGDRIVVDMLSYWTLRRVPFLRPLATDIERWDILVFKNDEAGENFIKRVGGLPGDEIAVSHGDLFVDGRCATKSESVREAMLIPMIAPEKHEPDALLRVWKFDGGTWSAESRRLVVSTGVGETASLAYPRSLRSWYIDHEGDRQDGFLDVLDLRLSLDVTWRGGDGGVRLVAGQEGAEADLFVPGEGTGGAAVLAVGGQEVARRPDVALPLNREVRLSISRIDGVVRARVAGRMIIGHELDWNLERAKDLAGRPCHARIRIEGGTAALRTVRIHRDVHYSRGDRYLSGTSYTVPDGMYFMLGDNSTNSTDSRRYGPFPEEKIIGRPHFVYWPPSRWRLVR